LGLDVKEVVKKIKLLEPVDVDEIIIERDYYFRDAYIIDLPLDSTPDHVWQDIFERQWKSSRHLWDRKLFVVGDKLRLVTTANDIEDKLDWIKQIIEQTNMGIEEYRQESEARKTQVEEEIKRQTPEAEKVVVEMIRSTLRKRFGGY